MELILQIIVGIIGGLLELLGDVIIANLFRKTNRDSYFAKKEKLNEEEAGKKHIVKMSKGLTAAFVSCLVIIHITEIVIIVGKPIITDICGFDYITTLIVWTVAVALDDILVYYMFTKATYDDEKIVVMKPLQKAKTYYFDDIESYSLTGNLEVNTTKGSFVLYNSFAGTETLRGVIIDRVAHRKKR